MKIAVVGTGYVGLVTGTCLADMGNNVTCIDIDASKIEKLNSGVIPIYEPGLEDLYKRNTRDGRLHFTTDIAKAIDGANLCFIAVGTPPDEDGSADSKYVLAAAESIGKHMNSKMVVVVKSTVPVGTCHKVKNAIQDVMDKRSDPQEFYIASNPEFLKEGKAVDDFMRPDRIVIGIDNEEASRILYSLYGDFVRNGHPVLIMGVRSAELTKYAANAMLATRISMMNELSHLCDRVGADIMDVRRGIGTDQRIGMQFLYAGIGYGGSCFPKDVKALAHLATESDCTAHLLQAVEQVNRYQRLFLANRIISHFKGEVRNRKFALWGLAFKANTDDIRESPALSILKRLTDEGAYVQAYDPVAMDNAREALSGNSRVSFHDSMYDAAKDADGIILATEWRTFRNPDLERLKKDLKQCIVFDGRNQYDSGEMRLAGFEYIGVGRGGA